VRTGIRRLRFGSPSVDLRPHRLDRLDRLGQTRQTPTRLDRLDRLSWTRLNPVTPDAVLDPIEQPEKQIPSTVGMTTKVVKGSIWSLIGQVAPFTTLVVIPTVD